MNLKLNRLSFLTRQVADSKAQPSAAPVPSPFGSARTRNRRTPGARLRRETLLSGADAEVVRQACTGLLERLTQSESLNLRQLLLPLYIQSLRSESVRGDALGVWRREDETFWLSRFHFRRPGAGEKRLKVGIFAGIHGDEPAGILGLMDFIRELDMTPELGKHFDLWLYPACNPTGCVAGTRHSWSGRDLNREFWRGSMEREVILLENELRAQRFDGIISLHSDDTAEGFYGYARGSVLSKQLLQPALNAAARAQARDPRPFIDGFRAVNGIIHDSFDGILSAPPGQSPRPFEIILESPARSPLEDQRRAICLALDSVLAEYRRFISYGADL